jgi:hypothetical protein
MTTIQLDFKQILNEVPFTGKIVFSPSFYGVDGCTFYVRKSEEVDLVLEGSIHSPSEIELVPSRLVGSYTFRLVGSAGFPAYYSGTIVVPDSGSYCLSTLVGAAEIEQSPLFNLVTSVNGQSGDVIVVGDGSLDPELLAQQLDPFLASEAELSASVQSLQAQLDDVPDLVLVLENQLI